MYETFYGLREKPFNSTPDPRFLYLGKHHQEALAHLVYGIRERKGFVVITGEVGTGKTTLIRSLLERLDANVKTALIFNPSLTLEDFFLLVADEFELKPARPTKGHFLLALNEFLLESSRKNEIAVLIIDEAQNLSSTIMEEVRMLLNLETSTAKLLQIILSGQPELMEKLNLPELRQLKQRISLRYDIQPLSRQETKEYVQERLRRAGAKSLAIFTLKALDAIHEYSRGIPRLINVICDNALLTGYADSRKIIDHHLVRECIFDLEGKTKSVRRRLSDRSSSQKRPLRIRGWERALMMVLVVVILGLSAWVTGLTRPDFWNGLFQKDIELEREPLGEMSGRHGMPEVEEPPQTEEVPATASPADVETQESLPVNESVDAVEGGLPLNPEPGKEEPSPSLRDEPSLLDESPAALPDEGIEAPESPAPESPPIESSKPDSETDVPVQTNEEPEKPVLSSRVVTVAKGDRLSSISLRYYGMMDKEILARIQEANPHIRNINHIEEGWKIILPGLQANDANGASYSIHLASFKRFDDAQQLFFRLIQEGHEAYLVPASLSDGSEWYRVTLGRFKNEEEAQVRAHELVSSHTFEYAKPILIIKTTATDVEQEMEEIRYE